MSELCVICSEPIEPGQPAQTDISGAVAHLSCLETVEDEEPE